MVAPMELLVRCTGVWHRLGWRDGRLTALDHPPEELARERVIRSLGGPVGGCVTAVDAWEGTAAGRLPRRLRELRHHIVTVLELADSEELLALLDAGIDIASVRDEVGRGALHFISRLDGVRVLDRLLATGRFDINRPDAQGRTPLDRALTERCSAELREAMLAAGAELPRWAQIVRRDFSAFDGTRLACHVVGRGGWPLVCLPGGPMRSSSYLDSLGQLSRVWQLYRLDLRGTGDSAMPADPATFRVDRLVDDVEALTRELRLGPVDLLAHSAGATLAVLYAARYPDRVTRLILVCPSPRALAVEVSDDDRRRVALQRRREPWFPEAFAAFERVWSGEATAADWAGIRPFTHGHWDVHAQAYDQAEAVQRNADAAAVYYSGGVTDPTVMRAAIARVTAPVLVIAGGDDVALPPWRAREAAALFPNAKVEVLFGCGHSPWLDRPEQFLGTVASFMRNNMPFN